GEPTYEVARAPSVKRVLKTPEYTVAWQDFGSSSVLLFVAEDWQSDIGNYENNFNFSYTGVSIMKRCFGQHTPFYTLYGNKESLAKWHVVEFKENGVLKVERELPDRDMNYVINLNLSFLPEEGLVLDASFKAPHDTVVAAAKVAYEKTVVGGKEVRVPTLYRHTKTGGGPELDSTLEIKYSNYSDESAMPPLTLADMGAFRGIQLNRVFTDGHIESRLWDGKELDLNAWKKRR
ncbi:MAG: hypothetical protein L3K26_19800, partial [Candidatus Hydrogenedentes bacterium]|nr:hypothetical protein [Candidatus Hydrogenedentota bacterium]